MAFPIVANIALKSGLFGNLKAGILSSVPQFVSAASADAANLVGKELDDFNNALTSFTQLVEAGKTIQVAYTTAFGQLAANAKSDAMAGALKVLVDFINFVQSIVGLIESAI